MSMTRLFPPLPFRADETHWSWAVRMAAFHILGPIGTFLRDIGLDPFVLSIGDPDELTRLCATAGEDPEPVLRNTLMRNTRRSWRLGEEVLSDSLCPEQDLRLCPACLAEDDAAAMAAGQDTAIHRRERLVWRLKPIRSCLKHRLPLICRDRPDHMVGKGIFAESVPANTTMLQDLAGRAAPCLEIGAPDLYRQSPGRASWRGMAGQPAAGTGDQDHRAVGRRPRVRAACRLRRPFRPGSGYRFGLRLELHRRWRGRHPPRLADSSGRVRSQTSSCRIKKWGNFTSLLDELRHPLPSNPLRRIFEEHYVSIVGT